VTDPPVRGCREALLAALLEDRALLVSGPESRFLRSALFASASDDLIAEALDDRILGPRSARLRRILEQGIGDGEVRSDLDTAAFADLLMATTLRVMVLGPDGDGADELAHQAGLAVANGAPGASPAPRLASGSG
jgi:hypothetical protein